MKLLLILVALFCVYQLLQAEWVHEMENQKLFQGDMVLDPDEFEKDWNKVTYASIKGGRWPLTIPYRIESSIGSSGVRAIGYAIENYHKYTCLRFKKRTNERTYVSFYRGGGCSSPVGYRSGRVNRISLGSGCWHTGIVMHEIGHTIGLYHEQSRPDRDQYVKINFNNVQNGMGYNFNKMTSRSIDSLGTPYDFRSMMHYGSTAFGGGRRTIETRNPANQRLIGQRGGFSEIDVKQINLMYCSGKIPATLPPPTKAPCKNYHQKCQEWANRNPSECKVNPRYMLRWCPLSCKVCSA